MKLSEDPKIAFKEYIYIGLICAVLIAFTTPAIKKMSTAKIWKMTNEIWHGRNFSDSS